MQGKFDAAENELLQINIDKNNYKRKLQKLTSKQDKFFKLSDSFFFSDEKNSIWDDWSFKMKHKLIINHDWYFTIEFKLIYVIFKLKEKASEQTMKRRLKDCSNLYEYYKKILNDLINIYENSDR